jgi:hypothetical protein
MTRHDAEDGTRLLNRHDEDLLMFTTGWMRSTAASIAKARRTYAEPARSGLGRFRFGVFVPVVNAAVPTRLCCTQHTRSQRG